MQSGWWAGRPERSTVREPLLSGKGPGRPTRSTGRELFSLYQLDRPGGRSARESLLSGSSPGRPGRSTSRINGQKYDRWPVDRPVDRDSIQRATALWSVDRADTESRALCRSTGAISREQRLWRSTVPVDRPNSLAACTFCARRSTGLVYRTLLRSTGPVDRQSASPA